MSEWRDNVEKYGALTIPAGSQLFMGATGNTIRGHTLDNNVKRFNEALRFHDPMLYTKWNPKKLRGWGCWEIRRRPEFNSCTDVFEYDGKMFFVVGPKEYNLVHHVLDCAYLNYDVIRKLKEMDTFQHGTASQYLDKMDRATKTKEQRMAEARERELTYMTRHYKAEIRAFQDALRDGVNPHAIAAHWDHVKAVD